MSPFKRGGAGVAGVIPRDSGRHSFAPLRRSVIVKAQFDSDRGAAMKRRIYEKPSLVKRDALPVATAGPSLDG